MSRRIHGQSPSLYDAGCRCEPCRQHHNARVKANRAARAHKPASHGTRSSYDAGCRCDACKNARSEAYARLEARCGQCGYLPGSPGHFNSCEPAPSPSPQGRASQLRRQAGIDDLQFIGGRMSVRQAAERLGVAPRTINRYRAAIRKTA